MQSSIFAVNDEPYCLWEVDLAERTRKFLDGIDPDYFDYLLQAHANTKDENRAMVALRLSLHHATETMFSLLGSFAQAPDCPYAWIAKCSNAELREFTERVSREDATLITKLNIPTISWTLVAGAVFATYMPGTDRQKDTIKCFARLWGSLTRDFVNQTHVDEYNALKHGFRTRHGGFTLKAGVESVYGVSPPDSEMKTFGQSKFGATFLKIESLGSAKGNPNIRSRQISLNWSLERVVLLLQLVHMSINNVVSALKVVNDYAPSDCRFLRPENDSDFEQPWTYSTNVTSINFDYILEENIIPSLSKAELLSKLRAK